MTLFAALGKPLVDSALYWIPKVGGTTKENVIKFVGMLASKKREPGLKPFLV